MNLGKKKALAAATLNVGKGRIVFNVQRLAEIKEAITKQDIRDLFASGAIFINDIKGRKTVVKRRTRRKAGSVKKKIKQGKKKYMTLTRKFRSILFDLRNKEKISEENYLKLRKEIRASIFKDKVHLKHRIEELQQWLE